MPMDPSNELTMVISKLHKLPNLVNSIQVSNMQSSDYNSK